MSTSLCQRLVDWADRHLVCDWRQAYRWFSIQAMAVTAAFLATWAMLPEDLKDAVPHKLVGAASILMLVLGVLGRLMGQQPKQ